MELQCVHIEKGYGAVKALQSFDYTFREGICGILGPNGAGKSTLMKILTTVIRADFGQVCLDGEPVTARTEESFVRRLGYQPQDPPVYPNFTARHFLSYMARVKGMEPRKIPGEVEWALKAVELEDVADKRLRGFSGGMRQRIGIAQALLGRPDVIILDEPTAGLDPRQRMMLKNLIADLAPGRIILWSTHIVHDLEENASQLILLSGGRIAAAGTFEELAHNARDHVWEIRTDAQAFARLAPMLTISKLAHDGRDVTATVIAPACPIEGAQKAEPTLEEVYLYYFGVPSENADAQ